MGSLPHEFIVATATRIYGGHCYIHWCGQGFIQKFFLGGGSGCAAGRFLFYALRGVSRSAKTDINKKTNSLRNVVFSAGAHLTKANINKFILTLQIPIPWIIYRQNVNTSSHFQSRTSRTWSRRKQAVKQLLQKNGSGTH